MSHSGGQGEPRGSRFDDLTGNLPIKRARAYN